jgi:hypothetical protein
MKYIVLVFLCFIFPFCSHSQITNTLQLKLEDGSVFKKPVIKKNVKVIINDTLVRHLITNENGITGFIEVPDGEYSMTVLVDDYKEYYIRRVKVGKANGKHLKIKLSRS